ncbi:MAG: DUF1553 domain-containing protein [Planctomycetales bacterium]
MGVLSDLRRGGGSFPRRGCQNWPAWLCVLGLWSCLTLHGAEIDFERDVAPILITRCLECHKDGNPSGGLNLSRLEGLKKGGDNGPALSAESPAKSYLLERVAEGEMPPPKHEKSQKLPEKEIGVLRAWIEKGSAWPAGRVLDLYERTTSVRGGRDWWSLKPVERPEVPKLEGSSAVNPIDAFVRSQLAAKKMEPAPQADRATLIRRLYFDLLGFPPSTEQVEKFVNDPDPKAYDTLVTELLNSPHFGERWGRHWLDVVRYADSCGYERDQEIPYAWYYRDWVVKAINKDKPYNEFVIEQLAGDELPKRTEQTVVGTGFLRLGTWNDEPNDPEDYKYERLEDMVHTTATAFLGMTVKCARCHDHKFDPIPQTDYYRIAAAFWPGSIEPRDRKYLGGPTVKELGFDVLGWTDLSREPKPFHLLKKGDHKHPGEVVEAGPLTMVPALYHPFDAPAKEARTTQRRLQLANWVADPKNPLTARVFVNRLWQKHFGLGLVRTPDNFGYTGQLPTHPELLDWLADDFVKEGWKAKRIHRLIVTSATYQQSSLHPRQEEYAKIDPDNRLWWRFERRRLDAESLRDAMLTVSGEIDLTVGGKSFKPEISAEALEGLSKKSAAWTPSPPGEQKRRSLYQYVQRSLLSPMMTTFDFCDTTLPCGMRDVTTVAPQALALMNGEFSRKQSQIVAERVKKLAPQGNPEAEAQMAWRVILNRPPRAEELALALKHLEHQEARFKSSSGGEAPTLADAKIPPGAVLHLRTDRGLETDASNRVVSWEDQSGQKHHASPASVDRSPTVVPADGGRHLVRFDAAQKQFLSLAGQVLTSQQFSILAVVSDQGSSGMREIISNWNSEANNSTTSVFLGVSSGNLLRFSDDFSAIDPVSKSELFVMGGTAFPTDVQVFHGEKVAGRKLAAIATRNVSTPYVLGRQGSMDGEYWHGDLAEIIVYDRALRDDERRQMTKVMGLRHGISTAEKKLSPHDQALTSLCHVLLNSNEFIFVD